MTAEPDFSTRFGPRLFWAAMGVLGYLAILMLKPMLLPFVLGAAIAYLLDPAVDWLELRGLSRTGGTSLVILVSFSLFALLLILLVPLIEAQLVELIMRIPTLVHDLRIRLDRLIIRAQVSAGVPRAQVQSLQQAAQGEAGRALSWAGEILTGVFRSGLAVVNVLSLIFITPVVSFYLLRDWDRIVARIDSWIPRSNAPSVREQAKEINRILSGFARGQALMCVLMAAYYSIALSVAGLDSGLVIGLVTGLLGFIPFVGTMIGGGTAVALALVQFDGFSGVILVGAIFAVGSVIEGYVLQPWLIGDRVGLHPLWMIFALLAGGALFGFVGVLLAVPVTAVIGVLARFAIGHYLASGLYARREADPPDLETRDPETPS